MSNLADLDLVVTDGRVVDPATGVDEIVDVGIRHGYIEAVEPSGQLIRARRHLSVEGLVVVPGLIDAHVHLSTPFGKTYGIAMVARAGVTACLELAGDGPDLARGLRELGCGIHIGYLLPLIPGRNLSNSNPSHIELEHEIERALKQGALGVKLLGGHYPLVPEAIRVTVDLTRERGCHLAIHCGSTETGSDIRGLEEAIELIGDNPVQIAHVNSYCRGQLLNDPIKEARRALRALAGKGIASESYLSRWNGTSGHCSADVPVSHVTRTCLRLGGLPETREGLERAIEMGYAQVNVEGLAGTELVAGTVGIEHYRQAGGELVVSFPVNPPEVTSLLATARHEGDFIVSALATDGGSIPRNSTVQQGLALVRYGALSLSEFVEKASTAPARMLHLADRGTLRPGSVADLTILDLERGSIAYTVASGNMVYAEGALTGSGGSFLTTDAGIGFAQEQGIKGEVVRHVT